MTRTRGLLLLVALTAGCNAGQPGVTAGNAPPGHALRVGLVEWRIVTSSRAILAGTDQLTVTNTGTVSHDLYVRGGGVQAHTAPLDPGASATLSIDAVAGSTLTLSCELPGHEQAGMHATVTVAD